jgi:hypothetical protein
MTDDRERALRKTRTARYLAERIRQRSGLMCAHCGKLFDAERRGARTCSNACRQALYRKALRLSGGSKMDPPNKCN